MVNCVRAGLEIPTASPQSLGWRWEDRYFPLAATFARRARRVNHRGADGTEHGRFYSREPPEECENITTDYRQELNV